MDEHGHNPLLFKVMSVLQPHTVWSMAYIYLRNLKTFRISFGFQWQDRQFVCRHSNHFTFTFTRMRKTMTAEKFPNIISYADSECMRELNCPSAIIIEYRTPNRQHSLCSPTLISWEWFAVSFSWHPFFFLFFKQLALSKIIFWHGHGVSGVAQCTRHQIYFSEISLIPLSV